MGRTGTGAPAVGATLRRRRCTRAELAIEAAQKLNPFLQGEGLSVQGDATATTEEACTRRVESREEPVAIPDFCGSDIALRDAREIGLTRPLLLATAL